MTLGTGLDTSFGSKIETTYGTAVTVDQWNDIDSESLVLQQKWTQPAGLAAGRTMILINRLSPTTRMGSGSVAMDFSVKSMHRLLKLALNSGLSAPSLVSGSAYAGAHLLDSAASPVSSTFQIGRAQRDGTVRPFTASGVRASGWEISSSEGNAVKLNLDVVCQDIVTGTALATPAYATGNEIFQHNANTATVVKIGGTASTASGIVSISGGTPLATTVKGISVKGSRPLSESYGTSQTMLAPLLNGLVPVTVELDSEFTSRTELYDVWRSGTILPLQITWTGSTISGGAYKLDVIAAATKITDDPVSVGGPDIVPEKPVFTVGADGVNNPLQVTLTSTDTAI
jgi:hypothetical protein